jgi:hypothetical protein
MVVDGGALVAVMFCFLLALFGRDGDDVFVAVVLDRFNFYCLPGREHHTALAPVQ